MRYWVVFFFMGFVATVSAQELDTPKKVTGTILNDNSKTPIENVNVINLNKVLGTVTNAKGYFELEATANDTLHISYIGFQSIKVRVTNDWLKNGKTNIQLTEKAIALEEVNIMPYYLTGYLEVDTKLIPTAENYRNKATKLEKRLPMPSVECWVLYSILPICCTTSLAKNRWN